MTTIRTEETAGCPQALRQAWEEYQRALEKYLVMRTRIEGVGGMDYSKDRVQGGPRRDLGDRIADLIEQEEKVRAKAHAYAVERDKFEEQLTRAGFDDITRTAWLLRYAGRPTSLADIAKALRTTKSRIQYITGPHYAARIYATETATA